MSNGILVGDIGGTKTVLAAYPAKGDPHRPLARNTYPSQGYGAFEEIVEEFLSGVDLLFDRACLGVAGPVVRGRAQITNVPWVIDSDVLLSAFGWQAVDLLNDMESLGWAVPILGDEDLHTLNSGLRVPEGGIAILAPGTGLGEGYLTYDNGAYHAHGCEGSHAAFAPVGSLQIGLLEYMNEQGYEHVSFERVCSGGLGIPNLYAYLKTTGLEEPAWLKEQLAAVEDPTPIILTAASDTDRPCRLAKATLELFVSILAAEAGNLALKILSTGGIYLGGGISPRILEHLESPSFLQTLWSKGRFEAVLADMPVHVILNPDAGLLGAAAYGLTVA